MRIIMNSDSNISCLRTLRHRFVPMDANRMDTQDLTIPPICDYCSLLRRQQQDCRALRCIHLHILGGDQRKDIAG